MLLAMAEQDTNFRDLLQQIETVLYDAADVDSAAFVQALQRAKPAFLNLLRYKASAMAVWAPPSPLQLGGAGGGDHFVGGASVPGTAAEQAGPAAAAFRMPLSRCSAAPPPPAHAAAACPLPAGCRSPMQSRAPLCSLGGR